jgi:hypothetical protein
VQRDYQMIRTPLNAFKTTIAHARFSRVPLRPNNSLDTWDNLPHQSWSARLLYRWNLIAVYRKSTGSDLP